MKLDRRKAEQLIIVMLTLFGFLVWSLSTSFISDVFDYIYESFTLNQGNDLTSDRMNRNELALTIIMDSPFFGNLSIGSHYDWVHNYLLRQFSSYGFVAGFPLLALYLNLVLFVIKNVLKCKFTLDAIGYIVFLIPIIISLEEPTFPYAPGTGTILSFILLGYSMRIKDFYLDKCDFF